MICFVRKNVGGITGILCKDGKYRSHVTFGTYSSCVKLYKHYGWAIRRAGKEDAEAIRFNPKYHELCAYGEVRRIKQTD